MTAVWIAVIWLVVGFVVAGMFGAAGWRANRLRENEQVPQRAGAEVRYLRHAKSARSRLAGTDRSARNEMMNSPKKTPDKQRHIAA